MANRLFRIEPAGAEFILILLLRIAAAVLNPPAEVIHRPRLQKLNGTALRKRYSSKWPHSLLLWEPRGQHLALSGASESHY